MEISRAECEAMDDAEWRRWCEKTDRRERTARIKATPMEVAVAMGLLPAHILADEATEDASVAA